MTILTKGMGVIAKGVKSWKDKRIGAMNRIGKQKVGGKTKGVGGMIDDYVDVLSSKAKNKKAFKKEKAKAKDKFNKEYKGLPK
tara:strand:- start:870 stop:1118 length:249 start_codon:yes stop_codon:yes gene_type:complete